LLILGTLFVLVTVFMPKGIVGIPKQLRSLRSRFGTKFTMAQVSPSKADPEAAKSE